MPDPIIEADDLATIPRPRLLDARDRDAFSADPVESAVRVPVERWVEAARADETSLANLDYWRGELGGLGLGEGDTAVIYDDGRMTEAARVWFILQFFGARAVVLNGGRPELRSGVAGITASERPAFTGFEPRPGAGPVGMVARDELKAALDGRAAIFDARTAAEYSGDDLKGNSRGGHLPGARLLPHGDLLEGGQIKPPEALRTLIAGSGFQPGDHIVTHCDGGGRAALAALAALRAGFEDVNVYYLSFSDWAKDESCPVVKPD